MKLTTQRNLSILLAFILFLVICFSNDRQYDALYSQDTLDAAKRSAYIKGSITGASEEYKMWSRERDNAITEDELNSLIFEDLGLKRSNKY